MDCKSYDDGLLRLFTAATHHQRRNETLGQMPLYELVKQSDSKNRPDQNFEMELRESNNETIATLPNPKIKNARILF